MMTVPIRDHGASTQTLPDMIVIHHGDAASARPGARPCTEENLVRARRG
jgi:hypothetical protein